MYTDQPEHIPSPVPIPSSTKDSDEFSSEDTSSLTKPVINCICLFPSLESFLLRCTICLSYSYGVCYNNLDPSTVHICAKCSVKSGKPCTSPRILDRFIKSEKSKIERKTWVFELMRLRVLKSILNEENKNVQPGLAADKNFLRLRFLLSDSYATRILLYLVKEGAIILYGGFKYDRKRILQLLYLIEGPSPSPPIITCSTPSSTPPLSSCSSLPRPSTQSILKPQPAHSSPSGFNHSSTPPSASSASNSRCSSRSLPVKKLRWDHNSSPLKNPFIES